MWLVIGGRQVSWQIHAVMQQSKNLYCPLWRNPEHHEMPAFSALPRHMQRSNAQTDIVTHGDPQNFRAIVQGLYGQR
jgi:hypothetical protein